MKLTIAFHCALALGLMEQPTSMAFTTLSTDRGAVAFRIRPLFKTTVIRRRINSSSGSGISPRATTTLLHVGSGNWENDDFLDSLSRKPDSDDEPTSAGPEGTFPSVEAYKGEHDSTQGASRFQQMMQQAQQAKAQRQSSSSLSSSLGPPPMNPFANAPFLSPPTSSYPTNNPSFPSGSNANFENLSVEEQAAMFRTMMQQQSVQPPPSVSVPARLPNQMMGGVDAKGRKIGRNKDTDTIANTSDLYFAQLKRDSAVRIMARITGDEETAEKVFEDEGVKMLENEIKTNPYIQKAREDEKKLYDTFEAEMMARQLAQEAAKEKSMESAKGPSYKEMLLRKKQLKTSEPIMSTPALVTATPEPLIASVPAQSPPVPQPAVQGPPPSAPAPVVSDSVSPPPAVVAAPATPAAQTASTYSVVENDDTRPQIRALQGMFLKHRGGPGFGSGLLRGDEVDKFESTLKTVGGYLREEAGPRTTTPATASSTPTAYTPTADPVPSPIFPPKKPIITPPPRPLSSDMTRFSPSSVDPRLESTLACVEGALTMYKNSPPELKSGLLGAVRAALLAAAHACAQVMEGTIDQTTYSSSATAPAASRPPAAYDYDHDAGDSDDSKPDVSQTADTTSVSLSGNDANSLHLKKVYDALENAAGEGKLGLGPMSSTEASELADLVRDMRGILLDELEHGIPAAPDATRLEASSSTTSSTYQQMLAKARAKKSQS